MLNSTFVHIPIAGRSETESPGSAFEPCRRRHLSPAERTFIRRSVLLLLVSLLVVMCPARAVAGTDDRPRMLVLTDIGGDPDDQQSLVRLMLYGNCHAKRADRRGGHNHPRDP
jgi:hypothetical protein